MYFFTLKFLFDSCLAILLTVLDGVLISKIVELYQIPGITTKFAVGFVLVVSYLHHVNARYSLDIVEKSEDKKKKPFSHVIIERVIHAFTLWILANIVRFFVV